MGWALSCKALPGDTAQIAAACKRCRTQSRPNNSITASIDGVCNWPVSSKRNGIASCGIFSE